MAPIFSVSVLKKIMVSLETIFIRKFVKEVLKDIVRSGTIEAEIKKHAQIIDLLEMYVKKKQHLVV